MAFNGFINNLNLKKKKREKRFSFMAKKNYVVFFFFINFKHDTVFTYIIYNTN